MPSPTFAIYGHVLSILGVRVRQPMYLIDATDAVIRFPFEETLRALDSRAKGLILCNPNNPLGTVIPETELKALIKKTSRLRIPIIIDEAYFEFYGKTALKYFRQHKHIIVIRTFSKAFGLAGLRFGYIVADTKVIRELAKLRLPWTVTHFSAFAVKTVLKHKSYFAEKRRLFLKRKKEFQSFLVRHNVRCYDSYGNFFLCKVANPVRFVSRLKKRGILVNHISKGSKAAVLRNTVRISVPAAAELTAVEREIAQIVP